MLGPENDVRRRQRATLGVALFLLVGSTSAVLAQAIKKDAPSPVTLVKVTRETLQQEVQLSGSSIPWRRALLSSRVEGLATRVHVDVGTWVRPGDPVLDLDARLAEIEIEVIEARVAGANAKRRDALRKRDELLRLKKSRLVSETSIESAIVEVEIANADLTREQAQLERVRELRERHRVSAPFAGMVVSKQVEMGQWVKQGDTVVELVEIDTLRIQAPLPQRYYPAVTAGAKARVKFDALPEREFNGQVFARVALGNEAARSFPLLIDIVNREHLLAPGMSARVRVELQNGLADVITVPRDAVVAKSDGERVVWRVREEQGELKAFPVTIETGRAYGDLLEVSSSELRAGDRVVMLGNESLRPGQLVRERAVDPAVASE